MKKKLLSILTLLLCLTTGAWADDVIFSATVSATSEQSFSGDETSGVTTEITSSQASISGGTMYAISYQKDDKKLIAKYSSKCYFCMTNNNTYFKVILSQALQAGDVISADGLGGVKSEVTKGLWVSTASSRPGSAPECYGISTTESIVEGILNYTVTSTDEYVGKTTLYIYRSAGATEYFNNFKITRPVAETKCATPTATLGEWDATSSKYTVTLGSTTTGATINYSTDNKATYTAYSEALALAPGTTLDAYATKDGLDNSDNMKQFTVPAAPTLFTITYANADGATGIVPAAAVNVEEGTNITLPKNYSMYKDGYTLTGWSDGETTYATGASYTVSANKTLTAVYTENTVSLADRSSAVTIKWGPFTQNLGIPELHFEGNTGFVVSQATVAGKTIDVKLPIDATNGKFKNQPENSWTQVNPGTVFTIPSAKNATISYKQYDNGATTTPSVTDEDDDDSYVLTADGTAGQLYYEYIQVVLPIPSYAITYDSEIENGSVSGDASAEFGSTVTVTVTPKSGYKLESLVIIKSSDNSDVTASCNVSGATFVMPAYAVKVSATFSEAPIVTLPTETRDGYSCDQTAVTASYSGNVYNDQSVYLISAGETLTLTVPSTTVITKIRVSGTSNDNKNSNVTITGVANESASAEFATRKSGTATCLDFVPTTQTTTYTISSTSKGSWVKISIYGTEAETAKVTLSSACTDGTEYFGTYSNGKAFVVPEDMTVAAIKLNDSKKMTLMKYAAGDVVPANTGVLVSSATAGAHTITLSSEEGTTKEGNLLLPSGDAGVTASDMGDTDYYYYRLTMADDKPGFWWKTAEGAGFALAANKAYLKILKTDAAEARGFSFGEDETTGVEELKNSKTEEMKSFYNLNGQRVAQPTKGLYIVNGKKVIMK